MAVLIVLGGTTEERAEANDRAALVTLYEATRGWNWVVNTNWNSGRPLDEWYGVDTDGDGRVSKLLLTGNVLDGEIPDELGNLEALEWLHLGGNGIGGRIPGGLGRLENLTRLELFLNFLGGDIPGELGELGNLRVLNLSMNGLSGMVPAEFGNLAKLERLNLRRNALTGPLPSALTRLERLENLDILANAGLCAPADAAFQAWLATVEGFTGPTCEPVSDGVPGAPTHLMVEAGEGALAVSWMAPADDGGSGISVYALQWRASGEEWDGGRREARTRTTEHIIKGLVNGTEYGVRVAAVNAIGTGAWSVEAVGVPATVVPVLPPVAVGVLAGLLLASGLVVGMSRRLLN